jgi:hypothetical protein
MLDSGGSWNINDLCKLWVYKNGSIYSLLDYYSAQSTHGQVIPVRGSDLVDMIAGDYIDVRIYQNSGGAIVIRAETGANFVAISRIGN